MTFILYKIFYILMIINIILPGFTPLTQEQETLKNELENIDKKPDIYKKHLDCILKVKGATCSPPMKQILRGLEEHCLWICVAPEYCGWVCVGGKTIKSVITPEEFRGPAKQALKYLREQQKADYTMIKEIYPTIKWFSS